MRARSIEARFWSHVSTSTPARMKVAQAFKLKAGELVTKLQERFPGRLVVAGIALAQASDQFVLDQYIANVHVPYGDRIRARDEQFFMTVDPVEDPMNMTSLLRGLWSEMSEEDRSVVWRYLDIFEKLADRASGKSVP